MGADRFFRTNHASMYINNSEENILISLSYNIQNPSHITVGEWILLNLSNVLFMKIIF